MADLTNIKLKTTTVQALVDDDIKSKVPTTTNKITNDANFVKVSGKVNSAVNADKTTKLTGKSGVIAGTYGPSTNVTIGNTERKSITIPQFTVNAQGIITSVTSRTYTVANACSNCTECDHCVQCNVTSGCAQCTNCSRSTCHRDCSHDCGLCNNDCQQYP